MEAQKQINEDNRLNEMAWRGEGLKYCTVVEYEKRYSTISMYGSARRSFCHCAQSIIATGNERPDEQSY